METRTGVNNTVVNVDNSDGKRQKCSGIELEDRLGNLPDSILVHILSFLPTRDAVKTVLISRFGYLWTAIHNLDFSWCSYHDCADIDYENEDNRCLNLIRHALILHARPTIYKFSLNFAFTFSQNWHEYEHQEIQDDEEYIREMLLANEINTWIRFAVTKEVKILNVDLKACEFVELECCYKLPKFVLSSCYLTELRLVACALNPGMNVRMKSLNFLSLSKINLSDELMNTILSGCPLLEDLYLSSCPGLHTLNFTSPCSKKLVILTDVDDKKLEISCPTVTSLNVSGLLERVELKNVSSVVDAVFLFSYNFHGYKKDYLGILILFMKLRHTKALKICTWCVLGEGLWLNHYDFDEENYWNSSQPFDCLTNHLKTVDISGKIIHSYVIQMVKFILNSSMVLEKLVIHTKQDEEPRWTERLLEYTQKLSSFPRASRRAVILLV